MTQKAPERIWIYEHFEQVTAARSWVMFPSWATAHEYIHIDYHKATVAAAYADCWEQGKQAGRFAPDVPDDATEALEALLEKARNEALREAAEVADNYILSPASYGEYNSGESHAACDIERRILELITEDQSDE